MPTSTAARSLDGIDRRLLDLLQADADRTLRDLGDRVGLSPSAVQRRLAGYERSGLVSRVVAVVDAERLGTAVRVVVLVTLAEETVDLHGALATRLADRVEVQQVHQVAGRWGYVVLLTAPGVRACRDLGDELFKADPNVRRFETLVVLDSHKDDRAVPAEVLA